MSVALPCRGQEEKLSREDTAAILFSNRFSFTREGEPVLSVLIMEAQDSIELSGAGGLLVHPSGPGGPAIRVTGKQRWSATARHTTPAVLGYRVVLEKVPTRDFAAIKAATNRWKEAGLETSVLELGTLFSFKGTVFDTRQTLLCLATLYPEAKAAQAAAAALSAKRQGEYFIQQILDQRPKGEVLLEEKGRGLAISGNNAVWFEPIGEDLTVYDVEFARGFSWHGRQTRRYGGAFYLAIDRHGKLAIVNVLPAEKLLKGLVPAEIYPDSPDEALKAQAITARNELFSKIGHRHLADPYHLCSEQHCQVYKGLDAERKRANDAVAATRGMVIFDARGNLADTRYHSTCGGHTEDAREAWPEVDAPNLAGRWEDGRGTDRAFEPVSEDQVREMLDNPPPCYCGRSAKGKGTFRWSVSIPADKLDELVGREHKIGRATHLEVQHRGVSGRANKLLVKGTAGQAVVAGELTIRKLLGGLKSSLFVVTPKRDAQGTVVAWEFLGGGFGHGVGMCQLGATEMARDGKKAEEILRFYYRGITIKPIY
jgi:SpoIID/LytB domain protein